MISLPSLIKEANWSEMNEYIKRNPFDPYCKSNVDLAVDLWYQWLHEILRKFLPQKNETSNLPGTVGESRLIQPNQKTEHPTKAICSKAKKQLGIKDRGNAKQTHTVTGK